MYLKIFSKISFEGNTKKLKIFSCPQNKILMMPIVYEKCIDKFFDEANKNAVHPPISKTENLFFRLGNIGI